MPEYTFIYALKDPRTNEIRYIGKADDLKTRLGKHIRSAKRSTSPKKNAWIRGILNDDLRPIILPLAKVPFERWKNFEIRFIACYREFGYDLLNETEGGTGGRTRGKGYKRSQQENEAISRGLVEFWDGKEDLKRENGQRTRSMWQDEEKRKELVASQNTPEVKLKRSLAQKKRWANPEERKRQSEVGKRNWEDPEIAERIRQGVIASHQDPECRQKRSQSLKKAWQCGNRTVSEETRLKMSESSKRKWDSPEYRARMTEAHSGKREYTDEQHQAMSARSKKMWETRPRKQTAEANKKNSESTTALWQDPEYVAKQKESRKKRWENYRRKKAADNE